MQRSNVVRFHQSEELFADPTCQADAAFEEFWKIYPRRVGKVLAKQKWDAIIGGGQRGFKTKTFDRDSNSFVQIQVKASPERIIEGARRYAKTQLDPLTYKPRDNGRWILHPATWLNRGGWEDH